jgi:hypothetical protein
MLGLAASSHIPEHLEGDDEDDLEGER